MKSFATLVFFFLIGLAPLLAQQPAQYSTYMLDPFRYNPAYAGLDNSLSVTGTYRTQWVGLSGNPTGQRISLHLPLYFLSGGFGLQLENDEIGAHRLTSVQGAYNYQRQVGNGILSLGAGAGFQQWSLDGNRLQTPDGVYNEPGVINHNDILLSDVSESGSTLSFSAGLFYQSERIEGGLSVDHVSEPVISLTQLDYRLLRSYYAYVATNFELGRSFVIQPSAWLRSDAVETQIDFSVIATYNDNIFGGASFRGYNNSTNDAVAVIVGFNLSEQIAVAYAYDIALSPLKTVHTGSHEIVLKYNLNKSIGAGRPPRIIYHPRAR